MASITEEQFLRSLDDLTGKVALVTGAAGTIGSQVALYLAARGCTVHVADTASRLTTLDTVHSAADWAFFAGRGKRVDGQYRDRLHHHVLDLSCVRTVTESATAFLAAENRLDIIVACAAAMNLPQNELSEDGWERTWAIAHLGHVVLIKLLLPLLRKSATSSRPSRVVFVSSNSYQTALAPDYELLRKILRDDFESFGFLIRGSHRYSVSKLCNIYYMLELVERLKAEETTGEPTPVLVNCCHPGVNGRTHLGHSVFGPWLESLIKGVLGLLSHTPRDCGKTGVYMAASADVRLRRITGQFYTPTWSWLGYWTGCRKSQITPLGLDTMKRKECWVHTEAAIAEATASKTSHE